MARPLTGSKWQRGRRFYASVPAARGSKDRVEESFAQEQERDAWLTAAVAGVRAGFGPPGADGFRDRPLGRSRPDNGPWPPFEVLARGWLEEYYGKLRRADAEREQDVRDLVEKHLVPTFAGPIPPDAAEARGRLVEFVRRLALEPEWAPPDRKDPDPGSPLVTIGQAAAAAGRSVSTIRRALRAKELPGARRGPDGRWLIPTSELAVRWGGPAPKAVSRAYARSILWAHAKILEWARSNGWDIPPFERDVNALSPDDAVANKALGARLPRPLSYAEVARVAVHLHVVHQLVLWLMRVLGLRISEAYGLHVSDVVDLGELGLVFVRRQGGRKFTTRTRAGVVTTYEKDSLKRAASRRVIVVPVSLMGALRVAVTAFHTDPATGAVDGDARLVPWIAKEGAGQSAFRAALDEGLRREGFDLDSAGFEVTTHDLRKSLATDLAWTPELAELAKRRVLGHKAGDDVFARVYTLDHPTLTPLADVARSVEASLTSEVRTLLVPTEQRVPWRRRNPIKERCDHVNAVLGEAGWQAEPGGDNPWCDSLRVAQEFQIADSTARRWMRDHVVPSVTDVDEFGNPRRRARLADVEAVREQLASRILLRDLAEELGVGYYRAWRALHRLGLTEANSGPPPAELVLTAEQVQALREEFTRLAALFARSMRVSEAATRLGLSPRRVQGLVRRGELEADGETDAFGAAYVTRASVQAVIVAREKPLPAAVDALVPATVVSEITGLNLRQLSDLVVQGVLVRRDLDRRFHLTADSVRSWATAFGTQLLVRLADGSSDESANAAVVIEMGTRRASPRHRGRGATSVDVDSASIPAEDVRP